MIQRPSVLLHFSLLRTIEDAWHLGHLGAAGSAATGVMREYFRN